MNKRRLFPLLLTPFERFMMVADAPGHPATFIIQYQFSGVIDRSHFEAALEDSLQRHVLLRCLVKPVKRQQPCWVLAKDVQPFVDWGEEGAPMEAQGGQQINLAEQVGLRVWVRNGSDGSTATFEFHHSCVDGLGAHRFIGDLFAFYGQRLTPDGEGPQLGEIAPDLLRDRLRRMYFGPPEENGGLSSSEDLSFSSIARVGLGYLAKHFVRGSFSLNSPGNGGVASEMLTPFPNIYYETLDRSQSQKLRQIAIAEGVTVNDVLIAALFEAMHNWGKDCQRLRNGSRLRVLMPTDLRGRGDESAPAANYVGWIFLTHKAKACRSARELVKAVRTQTGQAKHGLTGTEFGRAVTGAFGIPGMLPAILRYRENCLPTAVLTNVSDPTRRYTASFPRKKGRVVAGNLTLEGTVGCAPLLRTMRMSVAVGSYDRTMSICVRCDPYRFDEANSRKLLALYMEALGEFLV